MSFLPEWLLRCLFFQVLQGFGDNSIFNYHTFQLKTIVVVLLKENAFREIGKVKSFFLTQSLEKKVKNVRKRQKYTPKVHEFANKEVCPSHKIKPYLNFTCNATETIEKEDFVTGPLTIKPAKHDKNISAFP